MNFNSKEMIKGGDSDVFAIRREMKFNHSSFLKYYKLTRLLSHLVCGETNHFLVILQVLLGSSGLDVRISSLFEHHLP